MLHEIGPVTDLGAEFVQETASQGLTLVYEKGDKLMKVIAPFLGSVMVAVVLTVVLNRMNLFAASSPHLPAILKHKLLRDRCLPIRSYLSLGLYRQEPVIMGQYPRTRISCPWLQKSGIPV